MVDFKGQELATSIFEKLIIFCTVIGLIVGWMQQDFNITALFVGGGTVVAMLAVVPNWPFLNKHPVKFREPVTEKDQKQA